MAVRNIDAGNKVKEAIVKENPGAKVDVMELDLSSMASVKKFASEYTSAALPLNILITDDNEHLDELSDESIYELFPFFQNSTPSPPRPVQGSPPPPQSNSGTGHGKSVNVVAIVVPAIVA
ncbi:hypothetical protein IFM89_005367 [Coptis chinensis]|uniref:Uncharacterized protein n=1 Tax=Coptis chinensis TaxID=261450 RepID=A0A835HAS7_9MAGN|nr:hypothetical protein IFM89_005367 [Coptis chinensis]